MELELLVVRASVVLVDAHMSKRIKNTNSMYQKGITIVVPFFILNF